MDNVTVTFEQAMAMATAHHQAGRLPEAESIYRQILAASPDHPGALDHLGIIAGQMGHYHDTVALCSRSIQINPQDPSVHFNLAEAYATLGRLPEAASSYDRALALQPDYALALARLGNVLRFMNQPERAIASLQRALELAPDLTLAHAELGDLYISRGEAEPGAACYERVLQLDPDHSLAHLKLCAIYGFFEHMDRAFFHGRRAVALQPDSAEAQNNLAVALLRNAQLDEAMAIFEQGLGVAADHVALRSNLILARQYHHGTTPEDFAAECRRWNERHALPLRAPTLSHPNDPDPVRRLKVGYVSADFCQHAVGSFLLPLLESHDPAQIECHCFATLTSRDDLTARYERCAHRWHDVSALPDEALAERIREEKIDVLVDLSLHTMGNRLLAFARQPAPVQVAWLGQPGTTGLEAIGYRITDALLEPPGSDAEWSSEERVCLPDRWCCYAPREPTSPPVLPLPALSREGGALTFGAFNSVVKLTEPTLRCWARVLVALPGSRLQLRCPESDARPRLHALFLAGGVAAHRVEFFAREPTPLDYLRHYGQIDVALDTWPYNGTTTTCDALWMGVPVLTLSGHRAASRASLCLLTSVGLAEFAAASEEEFVGIAVKIAADLPGLAALRAGLRARMESSPLMDAPRFARNMEAAYRKMWQRWCENAATTAS